MVVLANGLVDAARQGQQQRPGVLPALWGVESGDIGYGDFVALDNLGEEEFVHTGAKRLNPTQVGGGGADGGREVPHNDFNPACQGDRCGFVGGDKDLVIAVFAR